MSLLGKHNRLAQSLRPNYGHKEALKVDAVTTAPTKSSDNINHDFVIGKQIGDTLVAEYAYSQESSGSNGSGQYLIRLPFGLRADTDKVKPTTGTYLTQGIVGFGYVKDQSNNTFFCICSMYDSTRFRVVGLNQANQDVLSSTFIGIAGDCDWHFHIEVPILGWG